ncbi:hypothetical protein [Parasphingorhabdus sp.]
MNSENGRQWDRPVYTGGEQGVPNIGYFQFNPAITTLFNIQTA